MVSIPACHAGDRSSILRLGDFFSILKDLNNINNRKYTELLKAIEFHYYSKSYTNKKGENKDDNKGIKFIKEFIETLYKEMTEERNKRK